MQTALAFALLFFGNATIFFAQTNFPVNSPASFVSRPTFQANTLEQTIIPTQIPAHDRHILGKCTPEALNQAPYSEWFKKNFEEYTPNQEIIEQFSQSAINKQLKSSRFKVFFGSWCGDSKREVPRFLKVLRSLRVSDEQIELIGVDNADSAYKRSPNGEEKSYNVFRVPTFVIEQQNREIQRITEYPVESLERDLFTVLSGKPYSANYFSYKLVQQWLNTNVLADTNISITGLAAQIRRGNPVYSEGELNACGYVLMGRGQLREALTIFRVNAFLFQNSSNCIESLSECYERSGNISRAILCCERALELDSKNSAALKRLVKLKSVVGMNQ